MTAEKYLATAYADRSSIYLSPNPGYVDVEGPLRETLERLTTSTYNLTVEKFLAITYAQHILRKYQDIVVAILPGFSHPAATRAIGKR